MKFPTSSKTKRGAVLDLNGLKFAKARREPLSSAAALQL